MLRMLIGQPRTVNPFTFPTSRTANLIDCEWPHPALLHEGETPGGQLLYHPMQGTLNGIESSNG